MSPKQLARWKRRQDALQSPTPEPTPPKPAGFPAHFHVAIVDFAVGWFLRDPSVWRRLHARYRSTRPGPDGQWIDQGPLPIPDLPPHKGPAWKTIFECVHHQFRRLFAAYIPSPRKGDGLPDDIEWTSYALSYLALRQCARLGQQEQLAYVHTACANAHKRHYRSLSKSRRRVTPDQVGVPRGAVVTPESIDLMLDLEGLLESLPAEDATVCRMRLIEGRTFREIGTELGIDPSTAHRRFEQWIGAIRATLRDYQEENRVAIPFAAPVAGREVAA
jgi:DNA-directed RNA polymerase specialized sigma24 family protein